jgi:putative Mg2+ transporter-C (MgtC) family protein
MYLLSEDLLKVILAIVLGGLIGIERELRDKAAGFRTMIFICLGSTLFTIFSLRLGSGVELTRIAANIVVGIGFLGAGVIIRESSGRVMGLTTAATIWLVAALGMGVGAGNYFLSCMVAFVAFLILWLFPQLELLIDHAHSERAYRVVTPINAEKLGELRKTFKECGLHVRRFQQEKVENRMISIFYVAGRQRAFELLNERLLADPEVLEYKS